MRTITTYKRLENHITSWCEGYIPFLAVIGAPGVGKSWIYEQRLDKIPHHLFRGRTTAIQIFITLLDQPDCPIVFDDIGELLLDKSCIDLLKSLCDSRGKRRVQWNTTTPLLEGRPREFTTSAPVLLVSNRTLTDNNDDVAAILDRADPIEFRPVKSEIIQKLKTYAQEADIVAALEQMPVLPSLRTYDKARAWKRSPYLDWRQEILAECGVEPHIAILADILQKYPSELHVSLYQQQTGRSRRDYFNQVPKSRQLLPPI
jgi:hypothetical protein